MTQTTEASLDAMQEAPAEHVATIHRGVRRHFFADPLEALRETAEEARQDSLRDPRRQELKFGFTMTSYPRKDGSGWCAFIYAGNREDLPEHPSRFSGVFEGSTRDVVEDLCRKWATTHSEQVASEMREVLFQENSPKTEQFILSVPPLTEEEIRARTRSIEVIPYGVDTRVEGESRLPNNETPSESY